MNVNGVSNNNQTNFKQRLYLKSIEPENMKFFRGIAKDFHNATKDIKGKSFTLEQGPDAFRLTSNEKKGFAARFKLASDKNKNEFINLLKSTARLLRLCEDRCPKAPKNPSEVSEIAVSFKDTSNFMQIAEDVEKFQRAVENLCKNK